MQLPRLYDFTGSTKSKGNVKMQEVSIAWSRDLADRCELQKNSGALTALMMPCWHFQLQPAELGQTGGQLSQAENIFPPRVPTPMEPFSFWSHIWVPPRKHPNKERIHLSSCWDVHLPMFEDMWYSHMLFLVTILTITKNIVIYGSPSCSHCLNFPLIFQPLCTNH